MTKKLFLIGGGEMDDEMMEIFDSLLSLSSHKKVAFLSTASNDSIEYIHSFSQKIQHLGGKAEVLNHKIGKDTAFSVAKRNQIFFVGGGSTSHLVETIRTTYLLDVIKYAINQGVIMSGISSGAICWFENGISSVSTGMKLIDCLGLYKGTIVPHYDESDYYNAYQNFSKEISSGFAIGSYSALYINDNSLIYFGRKQVELI